MQGAQLVYQSLSSNIIHVPGYNPSISSFANQLLDAATLAGTNCFVIGTGDERIMIDAGDDFPLNEVFVSNLEKLMRE